MLNQRWVESGTTTYQRADGKFNVFPSTHVLLGLYSHDELSYAGIDEAIMSDFESAVAETINAKPELVRRFSCKRLSNSRRESVYSVTSMSEDDKEHTVVLRNIPKHDGIDVYLNWFKNLISDCTCGYNTYNKICAVPFEICQQWGSDMDEYNQRMSSGDKPYVDPECKHIIPCLKSEGVYPFSDKDKYALLFPTFAKSFINESGKGKIKLMEMDIVLKKFNIALGLQDIATHFLNETKRKAIKEKELRELEKKIMPITL